MYVTNGSAISRSIRGQSFRAFPGRPGRISGKLVSAFLLGMERRPVCTCALAQILLGAGLVAAVGLTVLLFGLPLWIFCGIL